MTNSIKEIAGTNTFLLTDGGLSAAAFLRAIEVCGGRTDGLCCQITNGGSEAMEIVLPVRVSIPMPQRETPYATRKGWSVGNIKADAIIAPTMTNSAQTLLSIPGNDGSYKTSNPRRDPGDPGYPGVDRDKGH